MFSATRAAAVGPSKPASCCRCFPTGVRACRARGRRAMQVSPAARRAGAARRRLEALHRVVRARRDRRARRSSPRDSAATHKPGLGNTGILEQALASGAVDVYPEYTGTIVRELLKREGQSIARRAEPMARAARPEGRGAARLQQHLCAGDDARARAASSASRASPICSAPAAQRLTLGLSHEFLERADGWPALASAYALPPATPAGLDHGLAYDAIARRAAST